MPVELVRISAKELYDLPKQQTVFFFPVGPIEDHGPHLPLGLDLEEASALCRMAAERLEKELPGWKGVLMPQAPLGVQSDTTELAITVRGHVLRDWLVDACRSLGRSGFRHFVCFTGHLGPRQLTAIEEAGKVLAGIGMGIFRPRLILVSASSKLVNPKQITASLFWPDPSEHGGESDTSVALALEGAPMGAGVDKEFRELPVRARPLAFWGRAFGRWRHRTAGYWGEPAAATADRGERILRGRLEEVFPKLRAVWEGANANMIFRSWYSILPPNKSFFAAWLLVLAFVALTLVWIGLSVRGMRF